LIGSFINHFNGINTDEYMREDISGKVRFEIPAAVLYAIAGFLLGAKSGGTSVNMGLGYELEAIAACTIGGVSVNGGIGKISGCVIGVLVFELLKSSMQFLGIKTDSLS